MGNKLQPLVVVLLASIATRLWNHGSHVSTNDNLRTIGWLQCMNAKNGGATCFCCDRSVRLFKHGAAPVIAEVSDLRVTNASVPLNVSSNGRIYHVYSEIEAMVRFPNQAYKWTAVRGESAACLKICDDQGADTWD